MALIKYLNKWAAIFSIVVGVITFCMQQITLYVLLQDITSWAVPTSLLAIAGPAFAIWTAFLALKQKANRRTLLLIAAGISTSVGGSVESCQKSGLCGGNSGVPFIVSGILIVLLNGFFLIKNLIPESQNRPLRPPVNSSGTST